MITFSRLGSHGQLGNQLFQVAMLIGVGEKCGYQVKIPKSKTNRKKRGLVELDRFKIQIKTANSIELRRTQRKYCEKGFEFDPGVFEQGDWTDYEGYYQTEKYFVHAEEKIRKEFSFVESVDSYAKLYHRRERKSECVVAVHIRRGDYLQAQDLFQILKPSYYERAMSHPALPAEKQFMVFSDDLNWCKENFKGDNFTFVVSPTHWHDLAIMTHCDAHIISASSFSWWGSELSHLHHIPNNITLAPFPWFPEHGPRGHYNMNDIIPDRWIKLNAETGEQL